MIARGRTECCAAGRNREDARQRAAYSSMTTPDSKVLTAGIGAVSPRTRCGDLRAERPEERDDREQREAADGREREMPACAEARSISRSTTTSKLTGPTAEARRSHDEGARR